jgi:succinate-semialdehyde dehydrogenase/glutarate-semialdehyde dehydrogenase
MISPNASPRDGRRPNIVSDPAAPFGGWKHSGLGREGGHDGLLDEEEYLKTNYVIVQY